MLRNESPDRIGHASSKMSPGVCRGSFASAGRSCLLFPNEWPSWTAQRSGGFRPADPARLRIPGRIVDLQAVAVEQAVRGSVVVRVDLLVGGHGERGNDGNDHAAVGRINDGVKRVFEIAFIADIIIAADRAVDDEGIVEQRTDGLGSAFFRGWREYRRSAGAD